MSHLLRQYDRLGDRARLHRQADSRPILIVEGNSDARFLQRVLGKNNAQILVGGTRAPVLEAARDVRRHGLARCACVLDRDFDEEVSVAEAASLPIAAYDGADIEHMLLMTGAFDAMVEELGSTEKLNRFGGVDKLREVAISRARSLAALRRANAMNGWGIDFNSVDLSARLDRRTLELNESGLLDAVFSAAPGSLTRGALQRHSENLVRCPRTGHVLVRGRDALAVVGVSLRKIAGSMTRAESAPERLADILRLSADRPSVEQTAWLSSLKSLIE
jgi:Protein of unknown function (DUF4435)